MPVPVAGGLDLVGMSCSDVAFKREIERPRDTKTLVSISGQRSLLLHPRYCQRTQTSLLKDRGKLTDIHNKRGCLGHWCQSKLAIYEESETVVLKVQSILLCLLVVSKLLTSSNPNSIASLTASLGKKYLPCLYP